MQRFKSILFLMFALLATTIPAISQAQWQAQSAFYTKGSELVIQAGSGHYLIETGTAWGGVTCVVDPPIGGECDVEVTIGFAWLWTGNISKITALVVTPTGDLIGDGVFPGPAYYLSSVGTFGLGKTADTTTIPGPYHLSPSGTQQTFQPDPKKPGIAVSGQVHAIAKMPGGPWPSGTSGVATITWTMP